MAKHKTPMLDQLESGPWPSFVSDLKQEAANRAANPNNVEYQIPVDVVEDLLGVMELSYEHGRTHWKHGGIVGVFRIRRRRNRSVLRRAPGVPRRGPLPHHACQPAGR
jgi:hypothetical protein